MHTCAPTPRTSGNTLGLFERWNILCGRNGWCVPVNTAVVSQIKMALIREEEAGGSLWVGGQPYTYGEFQDASTV